MCKGIHSIRGVIEKPQCPGFRALLHGTVSGFFISDGYLGADMETDRISEPRMIQGSPLKINRQTVLTFVSPIYFCITLCEARHQHTKSDLASVTHTHTHTHTQRTVCEKKKILCILRIEHLCIFISGGSADSHAEITPIFFIYDFN